MPSESKQHKDTESLLKKSFFARWTTDSWGWEVLSWVASAFLLATAFSLLASRDDKELPKWYLGITINTVLSILSSLFQWSLMIPVIACIGQLKWLWFTQRKRPLCELTKFEEASSSPFGALVLLRTSSINHLVLIGVLITVITPSFLTFIQQALSYEVRLKPSGDAFISRCTGFFEVDGFKSSLTHVYTANSIKSSIYNGLYNSDIYLENVTPTCATGNCSWPIHSSLAICASTADISPLIIKSCTPPSNSSCTYELPSGGFLAGENEYMSLIPADEDKFTSIAFPQSTYIFDFFTFLISNKTSAPILLESSFNLCVQSYNVSVSNGKTSIEIMDTWYTLNTTGTIVVEVPGQNSTFEMGDYSFRSINNFLEEIFVGTYITNNETITYGSDAIEVLVDTLLVAPWDAAAMSIFLEGMATSITNTLRSGVWSNIITGTSYSPATYVNVQWLWLIPPSVLVILTFIFLSVTISRSRQGKVKVWKTSSLATLYCLNRGLETVTMMEGKAEKNLVQLKEEGQRWWLQ